MLLLLGRLLLMLLLLLLLELPQILVARTKIFDHSTYYDCPKKKALSFFLFASTLSADIIIMFRNAAFFSCLTLHADEGISPDGHTDTDNNGNSTATTTTATQDHEQRGPERFAAYAARAAMTLKRGLR